MSEDDGAEGDGSSRRRALKLFGGGLLAAAGARVGYEITGYGTVSGTNVTEQQLGPLARKALRPYPFDYAFRGGRLAFDGEELSYEAGGAERVAVAVHEQTPERAAAAGDEHDVAGPFRELTADIGVVAAGDVRFAFSEIGAFFERLANATTRPVTVAAFRGSDYGTPDAETLREFTDAEPADPQRLAAGLAAGFREHAHFDVARWIARNTEDHLLFGAVPLGAYVSEPTGFEELQHGSTGLYCWEYTRRSLAAFHALPPHEQSPPVFGAVVTDDRHNHMYTGLASVVRENGDLVVPMTFLDYSHSTMYDSYGLQWAFGAGIDAYDHDHRASGIRYTW